MRKLTYFVHTTVDGFVQGPEGEFDWPVMGPELSDYSFELNEENDITLYGRVTWEMMVSWWPDAESRTDHPHVVRYAPVWRGSRKMVVSRTLQDAEWAERVIGSDLGAQVRELKEQDGRGLLLMGGARAATSLARLGLLDEVRVAVHPVVLGGGTSLFPGLDRRLGLRLLETRTFDEGVVMHRYAAAS
ncbi:dihydrofolate reductase [Actinomadura logoneensis]|uniref:Dihydrofolate reductase n=1 Tax=Actinomadura logoneensis TaxID=2293572 RepID=A0A372JML6_9ACTN|nr:dihydrofolate reductase family protein [Actinomadura logoneensis]RFU41261.1 dihydrofolate reductase [Actinomadura logoneensis]